MGQRRRHPTTKSHTLPSSPTHSSSSSDFEFTISLSPRKSSAALCPADELFYKGQLLPLHLSPRLSMVRTLLLSSASTSSSSDTTTTASRDSTASSDSSRPSSVTDDELKRLTINKKPPSKYFSLSKFSSVFRKEHKDAAPPSSGGGAAVKRVIRKCFNKVKPLYEKLSQKQQQQQQYQPFFEKLTQKQQQQQQLQQPLYEKLPQKQQQQQQQKVSRPSSKFWTSANTTICMTRDRNYKDPMDNARTNIPLSFSGNLRYPIRRRSCISSCPSSMGSSPSHGKSGFGSTQMGRTGSGNFNSDSSSMEELHSAIQGAIAHCKNSMLQNNKTMVSNEI